MLLSNINCIFLDVPSRPIGPLEVYNVTHNSADLSWKASESDGGSPILGYYIEFKQATRSFWTKAGSADSNTLKFKVTNLIEDTEYYFQVTAYNAEGKSKPLESLDITKPTRKLGKYCFLNKSM